MSRIVTCSGCGEDKPHKALGKCGTCYRRGWRPSRAYRARCTKHGCRAYPALPDLHLCKGHITDELVSLGLDEFEARIAEMFVGQFSAVGECWEFNGYRKDGYGRIRISPGTEKRNVLVHNYVLQLRLGRAISYGALHKCNNPPCFRPRHLYEGNAQQNSDDRAASGRTAARDRHGKATLTPEQVREIVARYQPGRNRYVRGNSRELAQEFGIAQKYVVMIVKRGHWSLRDREEEVAA